MDKRDVAIIISLLAISLLVIVYIYYIKTHTVAFPGPATSQPPGQLPSSTPAPSSTPPPCNQLIPALIQVPNTILPAINLTANYAVNVTCAGLAYNASYEVNTYTGSCLVPISFGQPNSNSTIKIFLFEGTVTDANGNPVCYVPLSYQLSTSAPNPIALPLAYCTIQGCTTTPSPYMQLSFNVVGDPQTDANGHFKVYLLATTSLYNQLSQTQLAFLCANPFSLFLQGSCYAYDQNPIQAVIKVCVRGADGNCVASIPPAEVTTQINAYSTFSIFMQPAI